MTKKIIKEILFWLKFENYTQLIGIAVGILLGIFIYQLSNLLWLSIILGIIALILLVYTIHRFNLNRYADIYEEIHNKEKWIDPDDLRGISENLDKILEFDKELDEFFEKYSSNDFREKELNKQWKIKGKEFQMRANDILCDMDNKELLYTLLGTHNIDTIMDVVGYFKPYQIDLDYLINHPDAAKEYYFDNLMQQETIKDTAINKYYYERLMELNYFDKIEDLILSFMSNEELLELANSSKEWAEKLYFYGYLKKKSNDDEVK